MTLYNALLGLSCGLFHIINKVTFVSVVNLCLKGGLNQGIFTSIDNNDVPAVIYGDFRGSYRWNDHIQLYGAVDNAFNAPPPNIPTIGGGGENCIIYDCIGRSYRVGVRFDD